MERRILDYHRPPAAAEAPPIESAFPGDSVDTAVLFDVPKGTDVESIELHDGPFSDGVTVGLQRREDLQFGTSNRENVPSLRPTPRLRGFGLAPLAQSVERFHGKEKVNGSIPLGGSMDTWASAATGERTCGGARPWRCSSVG